MDTPLVLLDVDGVLNPLRHSPGYQRYRAVPDGVMYRLLLNPRHGPLLTGLAEETGAEIVWASYWTDAANDWISPRIGLPRLRHVPIPPHRPGVSLGAWKARHVASWVGERPFVWLEDEPDVPAALAALPRLGPYLIVPVDPREGLTTDHVGLARAWLEEFGRDHG